MSYVEGPALDSSDFVGQQVPKFQQSFYRHMNMLPYYIVIHTDSYIVYIMYKLS